MALTQVDGGLLSPTNGQFYGMKSRIINGAMVIDQRNAGASVTPTDGQYLLDRYFASLTQSSKYTCQQNAASVTPPDGFSNYLGITSSSAYTGTFGGSIINSAGNYAYPFSYTISSANTWTTISVTIAGPTAGTWVGGTNGIGLRVTFGLGVGSTYSGTAGAWASAGYYSATGATSVVGTNGATFYITGVQLEKGSTATSFDFRPFGMELMLCQRYYSKSYELTTALAAATTTGMVGGALGLSTIGGSMSSPFPVQMRTAPTMAFWDSAGTVSKVTGTTNGTTMTNNLSSSPNGPFNISQNNFWITGNGLSTYAIFFHFAATAEL